MWGLSPSDNNVEINNYKIAYGIKNPCAGTEGGGPDAIDIVTNGQTFLGYPTYCVVCPDKSMFFDVCWPPNSSSCFDPYIADCGFVAISADFTSDLTEVCQYEQVNFYDNSTGGITSWNWTFEGGDPAASTEQNPTVTYNITGTFDVELEVSDGANTANILLEDYIEVLVTPPVMLNPFEDVCLNWPSFELTGGSPAGGEYSGPGVIDGWFYPEEAGLGTHMISYTYTGASGCNNTAEQSIYVDPCLGIGQVSSEGVALYPNPSHGELNIRVAKQGNCLIQVYNVLGKMVYENSIDFGLSLTHTIDLENLGNGLYLISLKSDQGRVVQKIRLLNN